MPLTFPELLKCAKEMGPAAAFSKGGHGSGDRARSKVAGPFRAVRGGGRALRPALACAGEDHDDAADAAATASAAAAAARLASKHRGRGYSGPAAVPEPVGADSEPPLTDTAALLQSVGLEAVASTFEAVGVTPKDWALVSDGFLAQQIGLTAAQVSSLRAASHGNAPLRDDPGSRTPKGSNLNALSTSKAEPPGMAAVAVAAVAASAIFVSTPLPAAAQAGAATADDVVELPAFAPPQADEAVAYGVPPTDSLSSSFGSGGGQRRSSVAAGTAGLRDSSSGDGGSGEGGGGGLSGSWSPAPSPHLRSAAIRLTANLAKGPKQRRMTMMSGTHNSELKAMAASAAAAAAAASSGNGKDGSSGERDDDFESSEKEKMVAARRWDFLNEMNPEILTSRLEKAGPTAASRWASVRGDSDGETFGMTSPVHAALSGQGHDRFTVADIIKAFGGGKKQAGSSGRRSGDRVDGAAAVASTSPSVGVRPRRRSSLARLEKGDTNSGGEEKSGVQRLRELFEKKPRTDGLESPPRTRSQKAAPASVTLRDHTLPAAAAAPPGASPAANAPPKPPGALGAPLPGRGLVRRSLAVFQSPQARAAVRQGRAAGGRGGRGDRQRRGSEHDSRSALGMAADAAASMAAADEARQNDGSEDEGAAADATGAEATALAAAEATGAAPGSPGPGGAESGASGATDGEEGDAHSGADGEAGSDGESGSASVSDRDSSGEEEEGEEGGGNGSGGGGSIGAAIFSAAELLSLKLLFAIMDHDGDERIEKEELAAYVPYTNNRSNEATPRLLATHFKSLVRVAISERCLNCAWALRCLWFILLRRYAEETGDFAQQRELRSVMDALDSDGDGCIGLLDFVLFAARRKASA
jgi:hypothetical protein